MKIEYLDTLGFTEEKLDINNLKISNGKVEFNKKSDEDFGKSSKIITPDWRYYWDGERFGMHISDCDYTDKEMVAIFRGVGEEIIENMTIFYFSRTNIERITIGDRAFEKLAFLYFSENLLLVSINFQVPENLVEFYASNCPKLNDLGMRITKTNLNKIDISNCLISQFPTENFKNLEYLNLQNNNIKEIDIAHLKNLKYLFAKGNQKLKLFWPSTWVHNKLEILGLSDSNKLISKDILEITQNSSGYELREKLNAYLIFEQKHSDNSKVPINRYQIIFLGNTTSGKTELMHRLLRKERINFESTHGVNYFLKVIDGIEIIGYDFGGQDYYHALHLPFFDTASHYILVWGNFNDKLWGDFDPDCFWGSLEKSSKNDIDILNYPINYWIKSIEYLLRFKHYGGLFSKDDLNDEVYINKFFDSKTIQILNEVINNPEEKGSLNEKSDYFLLQKIPKLDIIQNLREGQKERYLNVKELKSIKKINISEITSFNFSKEDVGDWLRNKIREEQYLQKNEILESIKTFGEALFLDEDVLIQKSKLIEKIKKINEKYDNRDILQFINSLVNHHYLVNPSLDTQGIDEVFITNVGKFSEFIYQVLNRELFSKDLSQGYFHREEALKE